MATVPKSIRADATLWAHLASEASRLGVTANALAVTFIERGLSGHAVEAAPDPAPVVEKPRPAPRPAAKAEPSRVEKAKAALVEAEAGAAHKGLTRGGVIAGRDMSPPDRPAYGSRLKGAEKPKRR